MSANPASNAIVTGGISLAIVSALSALVYKFFTSFTTWVKEQFVVSINLDNNDEAYHLGWLSEQPSFLSSKKLTVKVARNKKKELYRRKAFDLSGVNAENPVDFLPGLGLHLLIYKGRMIWFNRHDGEVMATGWDKKAFQHQFLEVTCFGRSRAIIEEIVHEAMQLQLKKELDKTAIYTLDQYGYYWKKVQVKTPRPPESVILDQNLANEIIADARNFLQTRKWYNERGIPYRRGYLLYGPPGTGKTSFVSVIAGVLKLNIAVLTLSSKTLDDQGLNQRLHDVPKNAVILLEDVDAVFVERTAADSGMYADRRGVTFSGLLNALDGVASQEGRLLFMTTNHIERLDPALIRPGRCDLQVKFDAASKLQIRNMFTRFFPENKDLADDFVDRCPDKQLSMASLQGHMMKWQHDAKAAVKHVEELVKSRGQVNKSTSTSVSEWLTRLGLEQYIRGFARAKITTVEFLKDMNESDFEKLGVTVLGHRMKMTAMLAGRNDVKEEFELMKGDQVERVFLDFHPQATDAAREFAARVGDDHVSLAMLLKFLRTYQSDANAALFNADKLLSLVTTKDFSKPPKLIRALSRTRSGVVPAKVEEGESEQPDGIGLGLGLEAKQSSSTKDKAKHAADSDDLPPLSALAPPGSSAADDSAAALVEEEIDFERTSIDEFLRRLGFGEHAHLFHKAKYRTLHDIKEQGASDLKDFGLQTRGEQQRFVNAMQGNQAELVGYALATVASSQRVFVSVFPDYRDLAPLLPQTVIKAIRAASPSQQKLPRPDKMRFPFSVFQLEKFLTQHKFADKPMDAINAIGAELVVPYLPRKPAADSKATAVDDSWRRMPIKLFLHRLGTPDCIELMEKNLIFTAADLADCPTDFETLGIEKVGDSNTLNAFFAERADVLADFALASKEAVGKELELLYSAVLAESKSTADAKDGKDRKAEQEAARNAVSELAAKIPGNAVSLLQLRAFARKHNDPVEALEKVTKDLLAAAASGDGKKKKKKKDDEEEAKPDPAQSIDAFVAAFKPPLAAEVAGKLRDEGFDAVGDLKGVSDEDLKKIGVARLGDRKRLAELIGKLE